MFKKIIQKILAHKIRVLFIMVILGAAGYYGYPKLFPTPTTTKYVTEAVTKSTITVSVSGSGQVSELDSLSVQSRGEGPLTAVNFKTGDMVKAGQVIALINQKTNQTALDQAKSNLLNAQISYNTLVNGATESDLKTQTTAITQAEDSYNNAVTSLTNTQATAAEDLKQAQKTLNDFLITDANTPSPKRDAVLNAIQDKINSTRSILDNENKILSNDDLKPILSVKDLTAIAGARGNYDQAMTLLTQAGNDLATAQENKSDVNIHTAVISTLNLLNKTLDSNSHLYIALQNSVSNLQFTQTQIDSYKTSTNGYVSSLNTAISSLQSTEQALIDAISAAQDNLISTKLSTDQKITSAQAQVVSASTSLQAAKDKMTTLKTPAKSEDIQLAATKVKIARSQLAEAQTAFSDNIITAPFDGKLAAVNVKKSDYVSKSTVIATLITTQNIAIIPLNEVDTAKIKVDDKVNVTFDAIDGLNLTGRVAQIDTIGTVSQGVVTYNVKISFDTQDERIKPAMSMSATIITDVKTDVLAVPNAAVKTDNAGSYVQILNASGQPESVTVITGLANDNLTEVTSGLKEGDKVITQTITTGGTATTQTQSTGIRIPGISGGGATGGNRGGIDMH